MNSEGAAYYWFLLSRIKGVGMRTLHAIHECLTEAGLSIDDALRLEWVDFHQVVPQLDRRAYDSIACGADSNVEHEARTLQERGVHIVHLGDERYPSLVLDRLGRDAPPLLYCRGYLGLLEVDGIAIVGSRRASLTGLALAGELAGELALSAKNVVSGYAAGVDTEAHLGALRQQGTTTMVLSTGVLEFRPKPDLQHLPWEGNVLVISQFNPRERWFARNAMARNKLVCALSRAVVVVESGPEIDEQGRTSGTFDAARTALRLGVPLFVFDSHVGGVSGTGNTKLIELGGIAVTHDNACRRIIDVIESRTDAKVELAEYGQQRLF
jgi:DNA processing protein